MHTDRTDPPLCDAVCPIVTSRARALKARVIGLGAPLSVQITLTAHEVPALRAELASQLDEVRMTLSAANGHPAAPAGVELALTDMLDQLQSYEDAAEIQVLWPTALAYPTLRGALGQALDAVASTSNGDGDLSALACKLTTAQAALDTLAAFQAVDLGGLESVPS